MSQLLVGPKREAKRRGTLIVVSGVATAGAFWLWMPLGIVGIPITLVFAWRWIKYRGQWGLRF